MHLTVNNNHLLLKSESFTLILYKEQTWILNITRGFFELWIKPINY